MNFNVLSFVIILLAFSMDAFFAEGRFFCFRRYIARRNKCAGYLRRDKFHDSQSCCAGKGQGFADKKIKLGRNRFQCIPCSEILPSSLGDSPSAGDILTAAETTGTTTTTTTTTTEFYWPAPARRDYAVALAYPVPKDDSGQPIVWESWSPCSVSCGAGWRSRAKVCDNCDRNDYDHVQSQPCMINFYCPVDGNWGPWYPWESCSTTCNGGIRTRQRKCNYPPPAYGGADCPGDAVQTQECNRKPCPVDGNWGEWSDFSDCSSTCGPGIAKRTRLCDSPLPEHGGKNCQGPDSYTKKCEDVKCPIDGAWSLWSTWTLCSASCGTGVRERIRTCDSPRPQHGGRECDGPATDQEECTGGRPCPVDGNWSPWTNYGFCRASRCSRGYQIRSRTCTDPRPLHGGKPCLGQQYERVGCFNDHDCPRNGSWCEWSQWNACSSSCREDSPLQGRQRICACPTPLNGGQECEGDSFQVQECKDLPVCNSPDLGEQTESSGDGAAYDEESESDMQSSNTEEPATIQVSLNLKSDSQIHDLDTYEHAPGSSGDVDMGLHSTNTGTEDSTTLRNT